VRNRPARRLLIMVMAGALLVWLHSLGWLGPVESGLERALSPVGGLFAGVGSRTGNILHLAGQIKNLADDNARLERDNAQLRARLSDDAEIRQQNDTLRKQLGFSSQTPGRLLPATVIGYQPDSFRQFITINQGRDQGVKEGMAVVSEGSLVGRITDVTSTTAKVFLVTDPNFRLSAFDQATRATGTIHGQIGMGLIMDKIAQTDQIAAGDTIITSGLGGDVAKGIIIGQVESVSQQETGVFQTAQVVSALKFSRLELVFVVVQ
jgi:rod shape-determining protein MreC